MAALGQPFSLRKRSRACILLCLGDNFTTGPQGHRKSGAFDTRRILKNRGGTRRVAGICPPPNPSRLREGSRNQNPSRKREGRKTWRAAGDPRRSGVGRRWTANDYRSAPATSLWSLEWSTSFAARNSLRSMHHSPPRKSVTKPPASRTSSMPAATSHGWSLLSQ